MKLTVFGLIFVGIIAALSATMVTAVLRSDMMNEAAAEEASTTEIEILVAATNLPAMSTIKSDSVAQKTVLAGEAPEGYVSSTVQAIGQIVTVPMLEGQPILSSNFASDKGMHIAGTLPAGGRAMSIVLPNDNGIENLLYPGCIVDVMGSFRVPGVRDGVSGEIISATLLQGVRVLSIGNRSVVAQTDEVDEPVSKIEGRRRRVITLLVDPKQAEVLQLAMNHGELSLALRNPLDQDTTVVRGVALSELSEELAERLMPLTSPNLASTAMEVDRDASSEGVEGTVAMGSMPASVAAVIGADAPEGVVGGSPAPSGDGPEAPVGSVAAAHATPMWTIEVLRGRSMQKLQFPMEDDSDTTARDR